MNNAFCYLMLIFSGLILLYGMILYATKSVHMIPRYYASKERGKEYARKVGAIVILCSLPPLASAIVGLRSVDNLTWAFIILISGFAIWIGVGIDLTMRTDKLIDDSKTEKGDDLNDR